MTTARKVLNIHQRLLAVVAEVTTLEQTEHVDIGRKGFNYAGHDAFTAMLRPLLVNHGVLIVWDQAGDLEMGGDGQMVKRTTQITLVNVDDPNDMVGPLTWTQVNPINGGKGVGAAASYAKKYMLRELFMIDTGSSADDLDATKPQERSEDPPPWSGGGEKREKADLPDDVQGLIAKVKERWHDRGAISEAQQRRLWAMAKGEGPPWSVDDVKGLLSGVFQLESSEAIPWGDPYDGIIKLVTKFEPGQVLGPGDEELF